MVKKRFSLRNCTRTTKKRKNTKKNTHTSKVVEIPSMRLVTSDLVKKLNF